MRRYLVQSGRYIKYELLYFVGFRVENILGDVWKMHTFCLSGLHWPS